MERKEDTCKGKDGQEQEEEGRSEKPHCHALFFTRRNRGGEGKRNGGLFSSSCEMQSSDFIGGTEGEWRRKAGLERERGENRRRAIMGCGYGGAERGREREREDSRSCHLRRRRLLLIEFVGVGSVQLIPSSSSRS